MLKYTELDMTQNQPWYYFLPPDAFSRYFIIELVLKKIFATKPITILDVGGRDNPLWAMIKQDNLPYDLTVIDILPANQFSKNYDYTRGDALNMDFSDNSFDCVISVDVLEHIPENSKEAFINQCLRVAKDLVIIAAPFQSVETDYSEHIANDLYKKLFGRGHKWLSEHFKANKPQKEFLENLLKSKKLKFVSFGSNNLENWLLTILPNLLSEKISINKISLENFNSYFNTNLFELNDFSPRGYRSFYIIAKRNKINFEFIKIFENKKNANKILKLKEIIVNLFAEEIIRRDKIIKDLNKLVALNQKEINNLSKSLQEIYSSKTYKLSSTLRRLKNLPGS